MSTAELIAEGRAKLAAARIHPLLALDLRTVVSAQLNIDPGGIANAELIVWALNHLGELLDLVEATQHPAQSVDGSAVSTARAIEIGPEHFGPDRYGVHLCSHIEDWGAVAITEVTL